MKKLIVALTAFLSLGTTWGQNGIDLRPQINLSATAEKLVIPDEIYLSITLEDKNKGKLKIDISEQRELMKARLKEAGIDLKNLSLANSASDFIHLRYHKGGVKKRESYQLKLATAREVETVLEILDDINVDGSYISKVSHSKIIEFRKEARIKAMKAAREKADYLLEAVGSTRGNLLDVSESMWDNTNMGYNSNYKYMANNIQNSVIEPTSSFAKATTFKKIRVTATVNVKYEIKN